MSGCHVALTRYTGNAGFEDWHAHQNASLSLLLNGCHKEDLFGKNCKRVPGDVKFIPAGEMHRCNDYSDDTRKINIDLSADFMNRMNNTEEHLLKTIPQILSTKITLIKLYHDLDDPSSPHAIASAELLLYKLFNPAGKIKPKPVKACRNGPNVCVIC